jgi:hypothetical protein
MQYIYLQEQIKRLVLRKNPTQTLRSYHPHDLPPDHTLTEPDLKLLHKYSKKNTKSCQHQLLGQIQ